jgi:predicted amidohydrolase
LYPVAPSDDSWAQDHGPLCVSCQHQPRLLDFQFNGWGGSFIAGPQGELLATTDGDSETILVSDLNLTHAEDVRRIWPFLRDRRIEDYKDLARRYGK